MGGKRKGPHPAAALLFLLCLHAPGEPALAARKPARLIAMTLASAETLVDLAPRRRIVGLHKLAGDPAYSNVTDKVRGVPLLGSAPESVIALRPDVVFVASYTSASFLNHLRAAKVPVFRFSAFGSVEDIFANVEKMGRVIGEEARARSLIARARERLRAIRSRVPRNAKPPRVLALLGGGWTPGGRTSQDAMIRLAGGENAAARGGVRGTRRVSAEQALAWNPDVLVVGADPKSGASLKTMLRESAIYAPLRNRRIIEIPYPRFSSVSHYIVRGIEDLAKALHP